MDNRSTDFTAGQRLRAERTRRGVTLLALAIRARCSTQTIVAIERYGYVPIATTRDRLAAALEVDASAIWTPDPTTTG